MSQCPLVVSYGIGVDSTAMLVGFQKLRLRPDLILFADTGCERPETYEYKEYIAHWLARVGFPPITTVQYRPVRTHHGQIYTSLVEECLMAKTLPSQAFAGSKKCSQKWKRGPMDAFVKDWPPAQACWAGGGKVGRAIGYDAGPIDMKRGWNIKNDDLFQYWYPLRQWNWARERCEQEIRATGLKVPIKSSCYICPVMKEHEVDDLMDKHPELIEQILEIERRYLGSPTYRESGVQGLWGGKGEGGLKRRFKPYRWTDYIKARKLWQRTGKLPDQPVHWGIRREALTDAEARAVARGESVPKRRTGEYEENPGRCSCGI